MNTHSIDALRGTRLDRMMPKETQVGWFSRAEEQVRSEPGPSGRLVYASPAGYDPKRSADRRDLIKGILTSLPGLACLAVFGIVYAMHGPAAFDNVRGNPEKTFYFQIAFVVLIHAILLMAYPLVWGARNRQCDMYVRSAIWVYDQTPWSFMRSSKARWPGCGSNGPRSGA